MTMILIFQQMPTSWQDGTQSCIAGVLQHEKLPSRRPLPATRAFLHTVVYNLMISMWQMEDLGAWSPKGADSEPTARQHHWREQLYLVKTPCCMPRFSTPSLLTGAVCVSLEVTLV